MAGSLTREDFMRLFSELEKLGFRKLTNFEIAEELHIKTSVKRMVTKGTGSGFMTQYRYEYNGIQITFNTSWYEALGEAEKQANLLVKDTVTNTELWIPPMRRTKHFVDNAVDGAEACVDFAHNWPDDPDCINRMHLEHIKGVMHEMYFTCKTREPKHIHRKRRAEIYFLDIPLNDKSKEYFEKKFSGYQKYVHRETMQGKGHTPQRVLNAQKNVPRGSLKEPVQNPSK
jgi:hypothetical protein